MAKLSFDATNRPASAIGLTFGRSRSELRWTDRRELSFDALFALLSTSSIGSKDGSCYTPAVFSGHARRMEQTVQIDIVVLDADCGHNLEEIKKAISHRGWKAIIHSTFSHLTDQTTIAAGAYDKWAADQAAPSAAGYMLAKKGYLPRVVETAEIIDETRDGSTRNYVVRHAPCPKFRIILQLETPWVADDFETQGVANATWKERIGALSNALGLHHDQSCVDTSRLFYLPRRKEGQEFVSVALAGTPCDLWGLPENAPEEPAIRPRLVANEHKVFRSEDGTWIDLTSWAASHASRFEIATALRVKAPGLLGERRSGVKQHIACPNAADHVTDGSSKDGTFVVNASQISKAGLPSITSGFVIQCMHNGCASHDRLDHLNAMLCSGDLSIADLTDPDFLVPDLPVVDAAGLLGSVVPSDTQGNIAPGLYSDLPGALKEMHDYINATAPKPQPALNLGASLAFMAAVIGQRVQLQHWGTRPNLYVLGVAHSGAGKERPLSAIKQMARSAGVFDTLIGMEEIASDSGIVTSVVKQPRQIVLLDEVSFLIGSTNNKNAGIHIVNVVGMLLKLYSSSHTTFKGKSYADADRVKMVDQPCISLYGCSTPAGLFSALSSKDITSGLLSRAVLFDAGDHDPPGRPPAAIPVPAGVLDWIKAWDRLSPVQNVMNRDGGLQVLEPRVVMMTAEAMAISETFRVELDSLKVYARANGTDALYVRGHENALKFALVRACAVAPSKDDRGPLVDEAALRVDAETMRWAVDLSRSTVKSMERAVREDIADSQFEMKRKALRDFVKGCGARGASPKDLARNRVGRLPEREVNDLLKSLGQANEIIYVQNIPAKPHAGRGGRTRSAYVHKSFMSAYLDQSGDDE